MDGPRRLLIAPRSPHEDRGNPRRSVQCVSVPGSRALVFAHATAAVAQYPDKQITFVVPFAAGSATDQLARALGQEVTRITKQTVDRRQQARRVGLHRRRGGEEGRARRLHGVHHDQHDARRQRAPVQEDPVRPGEGLPAGHRARQGRADHDRRTSNVPAKSRRRVHRAREVAARARSASAAAARRRASRARCSSRWPASSCCTCRTRAIRSRSTIFSAARST